MFMPEKDGLEVIQDLTRQYPGAKVLAMSGGGLDGNIDVLPAARHFGAYSVLYNPFEASVLQKLVQEILQIYPA
jgi:DNA-binding NtrC family response regulator